MAFQKTKIDPILGNQIQKMLEGKGIATPTTELVNIDNKQRIELLEHHFTKIWEHLGMDLRDDSLSGTPKRMAKMWILETMWGLLPENFPKCTTVENKMGYNEMVVERNINVQSSCEHHGVNISGFATVAYIPDEYVLGLSKMNRIVEYFSRRPQIQERLTEQVFHTLCFILNTDNVAVLFDAHHHCVSSRGVEDVGSQTTTNKLGGVFKTDPTTRSEFMAIARM